MDYFLQYFLLPNSFAVLISTFIGLYFRKTIDNYFQKELEKYKSSLTILVETEKFDFQRKLQDTNLYSSQKHEIYRRLYKLLLISTARIEDLIGIKEVINFSKLKLEELKEYISDLKITNSVKDELINTYKENKEVGIEKLQQTLSTLEIREAQNSMHEALNYYYENKIYLSDKIIEQMEVWKKNIISFFVNSKHSLQFGSEFRGQDPKESRSIQKNIHNALDYILKQMREEISLGYHTLPNSKESNTNEQ